MGRILDIMMAGDNVFGCDAFGGKEQATPLSAWASAQDGSLFYCLLACDGGRYILMKETKAGIAASKIKEPELIALSKLAKRKMSFSGVMAKGRTVSIAIEGINIAKSEADPGDLGIGRRESFRSMPFGPDIRKIISEAKRFADSGKPGIEKDEDKIERTPTGNRFLISAVRFSESRSRRHHGKKSAKRGKGMNRKKPNSAKGGQNGSA